MKFRDYLEEEKYKQNIAALVYMTENINSLNESDLNKGLNDWLNKIGLNVKHKDGLINYFLNFTKGAGKLILAAIKKDKDECKKIAGSLNQKDVVNFLLKLDLITLHIVSEPLHFIEAITGWSIEPVIKTKLKQADDKLHVFFNALSTVKDSIVKLATPAKIKSYLKLVNKLQRAVPPVS